MLTWWSRTGFGPTKPSSWRDSSGWLRAAAFRSWASRGKNRERARRAKKGKGLNISEIFIRRPIATSLLMLAIALFGVVAYRTLPVSDMPTVDFPTISVSASLPGANPDTMASAVATPLERQFTGIAGLDSMISTSALGMTGITLTFDLSRPLDAAAPDVQSAIAKAASQLPRAMPSPPTYQKVNPADQPILYIALTSA